MSTDSISAIKSSATCICKILSSQEILGEQDCRVQGVYILYYMGLKPCIIWFKQRLYC